MQSSTPPNQPRHRHRHDQNQSHHLRQHENHLRLGLDTTDLSNPSTSLGLSLHNPTSANPNPSSSIAMNPHGSITSSNHPCNAQLPSWAAFHPQNRSSSPPSHTQAMALQNRYSSSLSVPPPRQSGGHLMNLTSSRLVDEPPSSAGDSSSLSAAAPPLIPLELLPLRPSNSASSSAGMATPSLASQSAASFFWPPPPPPPPPPAVPASASVPLPSPSPSIPSQAAMPAMFSSSVHMQFPLSNLIASSSHSPSPSLSPSPSPKLMMRRGGLDMNQPPHYMGGDQEDPSLDPFDYGGGDAGRTSESNSCLNLKRDRERSVGVLSDGAEHEDRTCEVSSRGSDEDMELGGGASSARKKLRLTKEQSTLLEESFKEHSTLNPKQKAELAKQLSLRPRQVEVWFQNRRARTKLKQTEVDCELLKRCCESLTEENRRLQKEVAELRAMKVGPPCVIARDLYMPLPAATLTMCPSCERLATHTSSGSAPGPGSGLGPAPGPPNSASGPPAQSSPVENPQQQSFNHMMAAAASNLKAALHNAPPSPPNPNHPPPNLITISNASSGNPINNTNANHNNSRISSPNSNPNPASTSTSTTTTTTASNSPNPTHFVQYRFSQQPPPLPSAAC